MPLPSNSVTLTIGQTRFELSEEEKVPVYPSSQKQRRRRACVSRPHPCFSLSRRRPCPSLSRQDCNSPAGGAARPRSPRRSEQQVAPARFAGRSCAPPSASPAGTGARPALPASPPELQLPPPARAVGAADSGASWRSAGRRQGRATARATSRRTRSWRRRWSGVGRAASGGAEWRGRVHDG